MRRGARRSAVALAFAVVVPLAGCGADPVDGYCQDLSSHRAELAEMLDSTSPTALLSSLPVLRDLAEHAPPDLVEEWHTFLDAVEGLQGALKSAGVEAEDFEGGRPPAGLPTAQRRAVADAAGQLSRDDVVAAGSGIDQQARDVCKVNLGL